MSESFAAYRDTAARRFELAIDKLVRNSDSRFSDAATSAATARLFSAMRYALQAGGKRLRPLLFLATHQALEGSTEDKDLDRVATALECLHSYSLIHDDLPAMDNDDLRRGKPSCHRAYDEATAILAGDALQSLGFQLISGSEGISSERRVAMVGILAEAIGPLGMAGGQAIDIAATAQSINENELEAMHCLKTGALIRASVRLGAICAGASEPVNNCLDRFASAAGLAFQMRDDVLDVESTTEVLGKTVGADRARDQPTCVTILGISQTRKRIDDLLADAHQALVAAGLEGSRLGEIVDYIATRSH